MSNILLYIPVTLIILVVLEACKQDNPKAIARKTLINFSILTGVLLAGSAIVYGLQIFL